MSKIRKIDLPGADATIESNDMAAVGPDALMHLALDAGRRFHESVALCEREMMDHWRTRLSKTAVAALSLSRCTDWTEASRIHQDWMIAAAEDYVARMGTLLQIALKASVPAPAAPGAKSASAHQPTTT